MVFRSLLLLGVLLIPFDMSALAQNSENAERERPRLRQIGQRGDPQRRLTNWQERMAEELDLDDAQRAQIDEIMAPFREQMRQRGQMFRQIREAEDSGDTALAEQLREQVRSEMGPGAAEARREMMETVATQIEGILRPEQVEHFREMRQRMQDRWAQQQQQRQLMSELPDRLNLDDEQRSQYRQLMREEFRNRGGRAERMAQMGVEAQDAVEQGDPEAAANLREELGANLDPDARMQQFLAKVEGLLYEEQMPALAEFRQELASGSVSAAADDQAAERTRAQNIRTLFRAVRRLNLNTGQEEQVRDIEREAMRAQRQIGVRDSAARQELFNTTKTRIEALLNDQQKSDLDKNLQRRRGRGR